MSRSVAHLALLLAAAFWGFGNISQKRVLDFMGPLSATSLRCAIAAVFILPLVYLERRETRTKQWWTSAMGVALAFAAAISVQQAAYLSATVTNASFLVNTGTVLTPLLAWLFLGDRPAWLVLVAASITLAGVFFMANGTAGFAALNWGDIACLVSAFFYAVWMVALGRHAQQHGLPFSSALLQFAVAALASMPLALWLERTTLSATASAANDLAALGIFATAAAFGLQTYAQRYTTASKAAVLVSAESLFGAAGAFIALNERPSVVALFGAALIFAAILLVSVLPPQPVPAHEDKRNG